MKIGKNNSKAKAPSKKAVVLTPEEIHSAIELKAYELYLDRNGAPGDPVEDWIKAKEAVLKSLS